MSVFHSWSCKYTQYAQNMKFFIIGMSSVNVTNSAVSYEFFTFNEEFSMKTSFFVPCKLSGFIAFKDEAIFIYFKYLKPANEFESFSKQSMTNIPISAVKIISGVLSF